MTRMIEVDGRMISVSQAMKELAEIENDKELRVKWPEGGPWVDKEFRTAPPRPKPRFLGSEPGRFVWVGRPKEGAVCKYDGEPLPKGKPAMYVPDGLVGEGSYWCEVHAYDEEARIRGMRA